MSMNRQKSPPCSTSTPKDDRWPRFLVVEAADDNNKSVKPMNNGRQLLVHFDKKICSDKLLYRTDKLNDIPVKVTPHRTLNYSRCVIWCKELAGMDEEDIQNELQEQGVTKVERMKRQKDGRLIPADSYILTINGQEIPKEIKVGFLIRPTKVYIPNPQRTHLWTTYQISQSPVSKIPEHPESPLSYRMGCRSNYIIEIISLSC